MRRIICILMCLGMASMVSALSITNGDFEALGVRNDVPDWFEQEDAYLRLYLSPNGTQYMGLANDDSWAYQSLGVNTGGVSAIEIEFEIGGLDFNATNPPVAPLELKLNISIYESDGSFEPVDDNGDDVDIAGNDIEGVTLIDSVEVTCPRPADDEFVTRSVVLQYLNTTSGELFLHFENVGDGDDSKKPEAERTDDRLSIDNVQIIDLGLSVVSLLPKDGTEFVPIESASSENDLIFDLVDNDISKIKVLFAPDDPNLTDSDKIFEDEFASPSHYTISPADLDCGKDYYWQVLAYEPNGLEVSLKYESPVFNFETIQDGPLLGEVDPNKLYVYPGDDAVFTVDFISKADALQWCKVGVGELDDDDDYAGVNTDTLTVLNCELADEGFYYCIGTETSSGKKDQTDNCGQLKVKQLMTYYPFETTFSDGGKIYTPDEAGGKHLELKNGASLSDANSIIGKNLWLDNPKNQYAQIADNTVADYEDITISFWCYATTLDDDVAEDRWTRIFEFGADEKNYIFFTMLYRQDSAAQNGNDVMRCEMRYVKDGVEENPELDVEGQFEPGQWYFIAITIEAGEPGDDASGRIYLGGQHGTEYESPQRLDLASLVDINKTYHLLGKGNAFSPPLFNGRIDEFKIYNYVRTSEEIAQDYTDITGDESLCNLEIYDLYDYDFDNSCRVDLPDFAEIAAHWLEDYIILPVPD